MEFLWFVGLLFIGLIIFTGGGLIGWFFQIIVRVLAFIAEGWASIFGCLVKLFVICFTLYVVWQLLLVL